MFLVYILYDLQLLVEWLIFHFYYIFDVEVLCVFVICTYSYHTIVRLSSNVKSNPTLFCRWKFVVCYVLQTFYRECCSCTRRKLDHIFSVPDQIIIDYSLKCFWICFQALLYALIDVVFISVPFVFIGVPYLCKFGI